MKEIRLNGNKMVDKASTHAYLKRKLLLPNHYGNNLDALWDCLSTDFSAKLIIIQNPEILIDNLSTYGKLIIKLFQEVARENKYIDLDIRWQSERLKYLSTDND
jgi:ribonuclease inhibitor